MNYYSRRRQKKIFSKKKLSFIELLSHKSSIVIFIFEKFSKLRYLGLRNFCSNLFKIDWKVARIWPRKWHSECIVYQNSKNFPVAAPNGHRHLPNSKSFLALISAERAHKTLQLRTRLLANKNCWRFWHKNDVQIVNFFCMNVNSLADFEIEYL